MTSSQTYSSLDKAAVVLLSLGKEASANILKTLEKDMVIRLTRAMSKVSELDRGTQLEILREFHKLLCAGEKLVIDGKDFAQAVAAQALGHEASPFLNQTPDAAGNDRLELVFDQVPDAVFKNFITAEHPQTVAFLLTQMRADQAAKAVSFLSEYTQSEVLTRLANLSPLNAEIAREVRAKVREQLNNHMRSPKEELDGAKVAAEILSRMGRTQEERLLSEIAENNEELAEKLRALTVSFEDLAKLDKRSLQEVLKQLPREQLVVALRLSSPELKQAVYRNLSDRAQTILTEDLEAQGPTKRSDVEKAQRLVVDIMRRLEAEGKIVRANTGEDEYV